jgi:serine/threonine-protein kinase HipA
MTTNLLLVLVAGQKVAHLHRTGTDGHAKNYSLMHSAGGQVRLAPLYDLASALPYDSVPFQKLKLAMKIGGEYRLRDIDIRHWSKFASSNRLDEEKTLVQIATLSAEVHRGAELVRARCNDRGLTHPSLDRLAKEIMERAALCLRLLRER